MPDKGSLARMRSTRAPAHPPELRKGGKELLCSDSDHEGDEGDEGHEETGKHDEPMEIGDKQTERHEDDGDDECHEENDCHPGRDDPMEIEYQEETGWEVVHEWIQTEDPMDMPMDMDIDFDFGIAEK